MKTGLNLVSMADGIGLPNKSKVVSRLLSKVDNNLLNK